MPMVRPTGPPEPTTHARVVRTESLKSERSDKRVSFNKDVGVKHIPRGHKAQGQQTRSALRTTPPREDEWAHCSHVHREPVVLTSQELEQQAEDLVRLLDHVDCGAAFPLNTRSLDRPNKNKNNKNLAHHTYNNVLFNNVRNNNTNNNNNNNNKNTNVINGEQPRGRQRTLPASRTTNPITRRIKGDVNRAAHHHSPHPLPNGGPLSHRHRSADHLPDTDLDSPPLPRRAHHLAGHKSVPDLNTVYYNNNNTNNNNHREANNYKYHNYRHQPPVLNYKSVENLYDGKTRTATLGPPNTSYKSVDNLTDSRDSSARRLQGYKSLGHLPTASISDSDGGGDMSHRETYRPKVGNIIKMFNQDADDTRRQTMMVDMSTEMEAGQRGTLEPDRYRNHNNNQPFSYTGTTPMVSVQTVRRLSPPRDLGRPSPPRDSPPRDSPVYAQVNKRDGRGRKEVERNYHNSRQDREYSAKIIITDDHHHRPPYHDHYDDHDPYHDPTPPKNQYQEDDDAYESYQVPEDNLRRLIHEDLEEYKEHSNNNINMSSVGVQTEAMPKAPSRSRSRTHKSPAPSPARQHTQKQFVQKQQQSHHSQKTDQKHPSNYRLPKQQDYYVSQKDHRSQTNIHNNLTSASLVRQVNHGFGRIDRSPSPPPRVSTTRQPRRNVVPLLSDTSDSEAEHRRQTVDPLARIRDQVMQREKLQEEEEEEEEARTGRLGIQDSGVMPYRADEMTPLTIDEVDALSLVMEDTGKKSLVVSNQAQSSSVTRVSNHRSRRTETVTERVHTQEPRNKDSLPRPQKSSREKNHTSREATPTRKDRDTPTRKDRDTPTRKDRDTPSRKDRDTPTQKDPPPVEKNKKNNLEKERASKAAKQKEEKKEKKKKRIKIKFFYDPRPQDDPSVDPLSRFTEFRGTSSDERVSPADTRREDQREDRRDNRRDDRRDDLPDDGQDEQPDDPEEWREERKDEYRNDRSSVPREEYHTTKRHSEERELREDYQHRRGLPDVLEDATPLKERRVGSRERLDSTPRPNKRNTRETRTTRERSHESYSDYKRRGSKDSRDSRDNRAREAIRRSKDNLTSCEEESPPDERRNSYDDENNEDDQDERGSPDGRAGRSLSDKYRSGPLYDPPDEEVVEEPPPPEPQPPPEDEEKQQKIMRQRSKFFSVLMSDGRNKNSNNTSKTTTSSKTKNSEATTTKNKKSPAPSQPPAQPPPQPHPNGTPEKAKQQAQPAWLSRERHEEPEKESPPPRHWESATLSRAELRARKDASQSENRGFSTVQRPAPRKYSGESSASSGAPPPQVTRTTSFKQRYFGDTDIESNHGTGSGVGNYRSLPNRSSRSAHKNAGKGRRSASGPRGMSPPVVGSAGSSLQSSESEVDSHGGSHASRASKASHVSTGSNRSVFLHATAVADIPVRRGPEDVPSERNVSRQSRKVSRSFSLLAPWKPRHYREKFEVEYDNREVKEARGEANNSKGALPPRPPRRPAPDANDKKVNRSQSMYKDSRLATWLRRRKNKEAKGI
ncbi:uncharacterized protein [Panulirus ornatus]|uniref:uncharacterized protein isoform X2 n=1 Tax=Panulirus ornatus TaxID=150431 RepID=UPI003A85B79A